MSRESETDLVHALLVYRSSDKHIHQAIFQVLDCRLQRRDCVLCRILACLSRLNDNRVWNTIDDVDLMELGILG